MLKWCIIMTKIKLNKDYSTLINHILHGTFHNDEVYSLFEDIVGKDNAATYASAWVGANRPLSNLYSFRSYAISYEESAYFK